MPKTRTDADLDALDRLAFHAGRQRLLNGQPQLCPRCGRPAIKPRLPTNALSRLKKPRIYICDACGNDEAVRETNKDPLPLSQWAAAKDPEWRCTP